MSSYSVESELGGDDQHAGNGDTALGTLSTSAENDEQGDTDDLGIPALLEEEKALDAAGAKNGAGKVRNGFGHASQEESSDESSVNGLPLRMRSPSGSFMSNPDETPSIHGSVMSSPGSSILPSVASRPGLGSPSPSFRPFDRRFQSRLSSSTLVSPRPSSPAFLTSHSRNVSLSSQLMLDGGDVDVSSPPWEAIRWTKLKKMTGNVFSEVGKRSFGTPTCITVAASIVLGTSKGVILIFDYHQNLKSIIGPGTKAVESGAVISIAISADHSTVAGGHESGNIFTWELARPAKPFLQIPPLDTLQMKNRTIDGHASSVAVAHLGFLGARHTALVSADDHGMAFSHLATRGLGAFGRSVKTTRILGRYPSDVGSEGKARKPSTVLAFAPLPLGNAERGTDTLGLTAMLTPYLLVIVSTTPIAETQYKAPRPKEVEAHSAMSGSLAWFPAVKLKIKDASTGSQISKVKLVYCWSNILTVLDIDEVESEDKDKPPTLNFKPRSRWRSEEAIVAVQWIGRSVLAVLTITQRLIILEDRSMRMTESFDLVTKHIYRQDLFSKRLHNLVEQLDGEDTSMHGVVADAFFMSLKAYKGRLFVLGFNDVSIGAISNWADRLIALMENGDYIGAIQLATSYYTGEADKLTVGLSEDTNLRHSTVRDKLLEIMTASLKFAFKSSRQVGDEGSDNLKQLSDACMVACISIGDTDFLFDEVFEWYESEDAEGAFLKGLEPYILDGQLSIVPPTVVKSMITYFVSHGLESRLEEMICHMETATFDIDQITTLCKQHNLYDALIYIWNQALSDYITPFIDLLSLLIPLVQSGDYFTGSNVMDNPTYGVNAQKMFPYMSYVFTGRVYPTGDMLEDAQATHVKAELYWFLFCGKSVTWPKGSSKQFLTKPNHQDQPSFPYLRMILKYDAPSFLSTLNEAFEDSFLNDSPEGNANGSASRDLPEEQVFGATVNRQYIVSILLEVMSPADFAPEDTIYLDMFIARNVPKFPQYILLSGTSLHRVLAGLCNYPGEDISDDAQLSAEYLLSSYHPPDLQSLVPLFEKAGFYRVLKSIYRSDKEYAKLIQTYLEDSEDQMSVFPTIAECLRPRTGLHKRQTQEIRSVILTHAATLAELDTAETAQVVERFAPDMHISILDAIVDSSHMQFIYLRTLLEPEDKDGEAFKGTTEKEFVERYVRLMCEYNAAHVVDFISFVHASDLNLDSVLPAMEEGGVVDAAVVLMAREGQVRRAMDRLIKHLETLEAALLGLLQAATEGADTSHTGEAAENLLEALQKYTNVGIWLCQGQMKTTLKRSTSQLDRKQFSSNSSLTENELLWLDFIDKNVQITKNVSARFSDIESSRSTVSPISLSTRLDPNKLTSLLRTLVQRTFSALLTFTSTPTHTGNTANNTFLRILRGFLTRASVSSPNLADLRVVLASIFSTYAYEKSILSLANRLLDKDLFINVKQANDLRQRGWRPRGSLCEGCGRRVWGPGATGDIFGNWEERQIKDSKKRLDRRSTLSGAHDDRGKGLAKPRQESESPNRERKSAKGKAADEDEREESEDGSGEEVAKSTVLQQESDATIEMGPLVVLACRHIYHQSCLEAMQQEDLSESVVRDHRVYKCPIDG